MPGGGNNSFGDSAYQHPPMQDGGGGGGGQRFSSAAMMPRPLGVPGGGSRNFGSAHGGAALSEWERPPLASYIIPQGYQQAAGAEATATATARFRIGLGHSHIGQDGVSGKLQQEMLQAEDANEAIRDVEAQLEPFGNSIGNTRYPDVYRSQPPSFMPWGCKYPPPFQQQGEGSDGGSGRQPYPTGCGGSKPPSAPPPGGLPPFGNGASPE